jgi:hypothetical protein
MTTAKQVVKNTGIQFKDVSKGSDKWIQIRDGLSDL